MWSAFTTTPIFNAPALRFPQSGSIGEIEIPIHITKQGTRTTTGHITELTYGSVIDVNSNMSAGGTTLALGGTELGKLAIEGFVDTPAVANPIGELFPNTNLYPSNTLFPGQDSGQNTYQIPGLVIDGYNVTYGEIIAAFFEGRTANLGNAESPWQLVRPKWYRDSYGRVYTNPRIIELTIARVEAVPFRNTFTMTLQV